MDAIQVRHITEKKQPKSSFLLLIDGKKLKIYNLNLN